ncbi:MAG: hypothetical protein J4F35_17300 [Candidatus Latescibacteria bacterium]|nr:hypothetical protein [Candidatus Latescibacterota bacterium]
MLEGLPARVCDAAGHGDAIGPGGFHWLNEKVDRTLADEARIQVLETLTALVEHH